MSYDPNSHESPTLVKDPPAQAAKGAAPEGWELTLLPGEAEDACMEQWRKLERRLGHGRLTSQAAWVRRWLEHYRDLVVHWFAIAKSGDTVRGMALVVVSNHQRRGPFRLRTIHLGTAGEPQGESVVVEFNTLLVEPSYERIFIQGLLNVVSAQVDGWDEIRLDGIDPDDWAEIEEIQPSHPGRLVRRAKVQERRYCALAELRSQNQDVLASLGTSTRSSLKRKLKQYSALEVEWAEDKARAVAIFEELQILHQARWQAAGSPGAFASGRFAQFQRGMIEDLFDEGRVVVFRARDGDSTIGCLLLLVEQGRLLDYLSGFAPFDSGQSPGLVTHYLCMQEALKRGYVAYDFLAGEKRHKENLGKSTGELQWVSWHRLTWKMLLCDALSKVRSLYRALLRSLKGYSISEPVVRNEWALQLLSEV
jgi:hypothetical protein